jgi:hypothetical protein
MSRRYWKDYIEQIVMLWAAIRKSQATIVYEEDLLHTCGDCGAELEIVRPGKYQCPNCE